MKKKLIILILILLFTSGCKEEKTAIPVTINPVNVQTKSCLITNNFYSDQCIEGNDISTALMDYVNVDYEFELKTSDSKEFDYHVYEDTYIVIEEEDKVIYEEKVDETKFSDIKDGRDIITIEGTEKIYPKPYIEKIAKVLYEKQYSPSKTYIKYIQKIKTTNNIKKELLEVKIELIDGNYKINTNTLT